MDAFSRTYDKKHYANAVKIHDELKQTGFKGGLPKVTAYEAMVSAFKWPEQMESDMSQHQLETIKGFQDNLNTNPTNSKNVEQLVKYAQEAKDIFKNRYINGEFKDPAKELEKK